MSPLAAPEEMTRPGDAGRRVGAWCGWVLGALAAAAPVFAWLGPLAFAPLVALAGLLALPGFRLDPRDRAWTLAFIVLLVWAVGSAAWSPYAPKHLEDATAVKLVLQSALYASAVAAARAAAPGTRAGILGVLAVGMAALGAMMLVEAFTGAGVYLALRNALHDPIRPDLAVKNVAQGLFILTLFAPVALAAAWRAGAGGFLTAGAVLAGIVAPSVVFQYDAPLVALAAAAGAGGLVWRAPLWGPRILAGVAAAYILGTPGLVWLARFTSAFADLEARVSLSWSERMGYWRHAADWISVHPLRGWGLDASRMFGPGIVLHPHNSALQVWLELGLIGAAAAAVLWATLLAGLSRRRFEPGTTAAAATAAAYLTFGAFSFGVWQEWWLGLGAMAASMSILLIRQGNPYRL